MNKSTTRKNQTFKKENPTKLIILFISTLGIYGLIWLYKNNKIIKNKFNINLDTKTIENILSMVTILLFFFFTTFYYREFAIKQKTILALSFILISTITIIWWIVYSIKYSIAINKILNDKLTATILGITLIIPILFPIGMILVQTKLNKYKKKHLAQAEEEEEYSTISTNEIHCKKYIQTYKNDYSKEMIKNVLLKTEIKEEEIDLYLQKYY